MKHGKKASRVSNADYSDVLRTIRQPGMLEESNKYVAHACVPLRSESRRCSPDIVFGMCRYELI